MIAALRQLWELTALLALVWVLTRAAWHLSARIGWTAPARHWLRLTQGALVLAVALVAIAPCLFPTHPTAWVPPSAQLWAPTRNTPPGVEALLSTHPANAMASSGRVQPLALDSRWLAGILAALALSASAALLGFALRVRRLRRQLGALPVIRRIGRVAIAVSEDDPVPYSVYLPVHGVRAWVVVPLSLLHRRPDLQITIRHELQHHRQGDTQWSLAMEILRSLFFWNPAAHALAHWMAELQEYACDEFLVGRRKIPLQAYGGCLIEAAQSALDSRSIPAGAAGMAVGRPGSQLKRRIEMMVHSQRNRTHGRAGFVGIALGITTLLGGAAYASHEIIQDRRVTLAEARAMAAQGGKEVHGSFPLLVDESVLAQLNRLLGTPKGREFVRNALSRLPTYRPGIEARLARSDLPLELEAVPIIESGYQNLPPTSVEPSLAPGGRGAGLWMFIRSTARHFGLKVDAQRDERLDIEKETDAAARYLGSLYLRYQDWGLALAAYNEGESHVDHVIERTGLRDPWALIRRGDLNPYAAEVMAAVLILKNPASIQ